MAGIFIFISGTFVSLLTLGGLIATFREFKHMGEHPEEYPKDFSHLREGEKQEQ